MTPDLKVEDLKNQDLANAHAIICGGGGLLPQEEWITEIKKWKQPKDGLARGIKVVRNSMGYMVACISYKVKACKDGEKCLYIFGILIPNIFKQAIIRRMGTLFETLRKEEGCDHLVVGYADLSPSEQKLFGNQLENLIGKIDTGPVAETFGGMNCPKN